MATQTQIVRYFDKFLTALEGVNADLQSQITAIAAAQAAADAAQTSANTAQTTANAVKLSDKITSSAPIPAQCLSASDAGSNATITIAANTRLYGDATQQAVAGGSLTGRAYSTVYAVYYDDTTCANATPTYHFTTTAAHALNNYVTGRHFVGTITTPASGGAATDGGSSPPGAGADPHTRYDTP